MRGSDTTGAVGRGLVAPRTPPADGRPEAQASYTFAPLSPQRTRGAGG